MVYRALPHIEPLEDRIFLSGNVTANVNRGVLTITGDKQANTIQIVRNGDTVSVIPDAGTTINKGAAGAAVDLLGVTGAIKIVMGAGNDSVAISGQAIDGLSRPFAVAQGLGNLTVNLGAGDDELILAGLAADNVSIATGAGNNRIVVTGLDPDNAAGGPADVQTVLLGKLTITGSAGHETVDLLGIKTGGDVNLKLSRGGNAATILPLAGSDADFDVEIGGSFAFDSSLAFHVNSVLLDDPDNAGGIFIDGSVRITLGLMNDSVTITSAADLRVGGSVFISGCMGDDVITVRGAEIDGLLIVYGSAGDNVITVEQVDTGIGRWIDGRLTISSFSLDMLGGLSGLKLPRDVLGSLTSSVRSFTWTDWRFILPF